MNPFANVSNYWGASFRSYDQNILIPTDNPGVCFSLALEWLTDFMLGDRANNPSFWLKMKSPQFIESISAKQKTLTLPNPFSEKMYFRMVLAKLVKPYQLNRPALGSLVETPNFAKEMEAGNKTTLIFMTEQENSETGHMIAVGSRIREGGVIEIGLFDANYGEIIFSYNSSANLTNKQAEIHDEMNETHHRDSIKTYEDAVEDLIAFYRTPLSLQKEGEEHKIYNHTCFSYFVPKTIIVPQPFSSHNYAQKKQEKPPQATHQLQTNRVQESAAASLRTL